MSNYIFKIMSDEFFYPEHPMMDADLSKCNLPLNVAKGNMYEFVTHTWNPIKGICPHGCKYCYANFKESVVLQKRAMHDPHSPLLVGNVGPDDKVTERKLFSFIKVPEPYAKGDIVKLKTPEKYKKDDDYWGYNLNLYKVVSLDKDSVNLAGVAKQVPKDELMPVEVNGNDDRWIYHDPVIMASFVFPGEDIPSHSTDYSYYMDAFEHCFDEKHNSFKNLVSKAHLVYVHEIQHYLRKRFNQDYLKINASKL